MREVVPARSWFVTATLALGVCAMVGVLLPWAHGLQFGSNGGGRSSIRGFEYAQGVAALAGALGLVIVSALRASRRIGDVPYVAFGTVMCLLSLAASIWFWSAEVGAVDPIVDVLLAGWFELPRISAGVGLYVVGGSALAGLLCLFGFAVDATSRVNGFRVVHDDRTFAGGSLVPNRIRFRIVSRVRIPR